MFDLEELIERSQSSRPGLQPGFLYGPERSREADARALDQANEHHDDFLGPLEEVMQLSSVIAAAQARILDLLVTHGDGLTGGEGDAVGYLCDHDPGYRVLEAAQEARPAEAWAADEAADEAADGESAEARAGPV